MYSTSIEGRSSTGIVVRTGTDFCARAPSHIDGVLRVVPILSPPMYNLCSIVGIRSGIILGFIKSIVPSIVTPLTNCFAAPNQLPNAT